MASQKCAMFGLWSFDISDCSDPGRQNNAGEMNPRLSGMERSASGRPGRAELNPSEAAGCRRRRAVSGRAGERGTMPAGWRQNIMHREVGRVRSVDCYFGLERERGELKGVAGGDEADANLCASFRPPIDFHIADAAAAFLDDVCCVPSSQIERFQG